MNLDELQATVSTAVEPAFRGSLLARGQARSMIWRDGVLPPGSPAFIPTLSYDLLSYGDALLSLAIRMREMGGDEALMRSAFEHAGNAIESVVDKGRSDDPRRGFHRLLAASAFHLGRFSARAFSLLVSSIEGGNLSPIEQALALLILRSLNELADQICAWRVEGPATDDRILTMLTDGVEALSDEPDEGDDADPVSEAIDLALTDNFMAGLAVFLLALETGDGALVEQARAELEKGYESCGELNLVPQWWCFRLAIHLIDDLWSSSFHNVLPLAPPEGDAALWQLHRNLFIASLTRRARAEIELWPSQIEAAKRSVDTSDDLVVSLPTSAGKTRVAELCILSCLAEGKRVVYVTPLRALSAQTETSLQRTFGPLGKTISALYGSIGTSNFQEDALKVHHIVVATPEKLDFALRNDPSLIDDVGLIVLDEGHMIGLGEREVRYEVQIQRLLKREDADQRRIVCLSAILPDGEQFDDFVCWIRRDREGGAITSDWRPTRIRFGEVLWRGDRARLELRVGDETPFVPNFFGPKEPTEGRRKAPFPRDQRKLVLATAWRLVEDGQSVLIYCPIRRSVEPFAEAIVDLASRGVLDSVLELDHGQLATALAIGHEWLGDKHPILRCLELGVAVHHGALPTPFRKEIEHLLREGVLKITVSSPTLAQGLNLTATAVVIHSLHRNRNVIPGPEFKNLIGRAGRAFIDAEGLVLYPIFDKQDYRRSQWHALIDTVGGQEMESGLLCLVLTLLVRLNNALGKPAIVDLQEYVVNNAVAWDFPEIENEDEEQRENAQRDWQRYLAILDTAILSLLGDQELDAAEIAARLDEILSSSLWQRRLARRGEEMQELLKTGLEARTKIIWANSTASQRKGYFLAGVGLGTGQKLDTISEDANQLLLQVNGAIFEGDNDRAVEAVTDLAEMIFAIPPFVPDPFPDNWPDVLRAWLEGAPIADAATATSSDVLRFVENGLIYKLPWGMEAVRVRALANGDNVGGEFGHMTLDDFEIGLAVPAIETGTLNRSAAILMQAGFTSRLAAIKAATDTEATFSNAWELLVWLASDDVKALSEDSEWPTAESHLLWHDFATGFTPPEKLIWTKRTGQFCVTWSNTDAVPEPETFVKLHWKNGEEMLVLSTTFEKLGTLDTKFSVAPAGLFDARMSDDEASVDYIYFGPDDIELAAA